MSRPNNQSGFSAIELLIALFVAAAFIGAGYQLYSVVIKSGGDTNQRSKANDIAYNALRSHASEVGTQCVVSEPPATLPEGHGLPAPASISVSNTCPYGVGEPLTKVQVSVTYGSPQEEVIHAIYAKGD